MAGPPVEKSNLASAAMAAPATDLMPGCGATLHFVPGGRSFVKSNTQVLSSTQRPVPDCAVLGVQETSSGAGSFGSPNLTMDSVNVARTCRTSATSPFGDIVLSPASARAANDASASRLATRQVDRDWRRMVDCMCFSSRARWPGVWGCSLCRRRARRAVRERRLTGRSVGLHEPEFTQVLVAGVWPLRSSRHAIVDGDDARRERWTGLTSIERCPGARGQA